MDYMMKYTSHVIVLNSLVAINKSLISRSKTRAQQQQLQLLQQQPQQQQQQVEQQGDGQLKVSSEDKSEAEQEFPVFTCQVSVVDRSLIVNPNAKVSNFSQDYFQFNSSKN